MCGASPRKSLMSEIHENALSCIGNTPIVRLNRVAKGVPGNFFGKLEFMNPGGSVKDRIGAYLIEDAEKRGELKPGGTVVEATSGNTGVGLGMAAAIKGYQCVFVLPDKMAAEKIQFLRAFGAEVVITPTGVEPQDPRSHYSVARRIAKETPNAFLANQYDNLANRRAHYERTGPEILRQMPEIDALVAGMGTGGTITGTGMYLKEKKPGVKLVCAELIGGFLRTNTERGIEENLNAQGMVFRKLCMSDLREESESDESGEMMLELVYGSVARLSALATGLELKERLGAS